MGSDVFFKGGGVCGQTHVGHSRAITSLKESLGSRTPSNSEVSSMDSRALKVFLVRLGWRAIPQSRSSREVRISWYPTFSGCLV